MHRVVLAGLTCLVLASPVTLFAQEVAVGPPSGSLVVVGGALSDPEIVSTFIDLAGGPDAPIVVVPTAGGRDDEAYGSECRCLELLARQGATNLTVLHTYEPAVADSEAFVEPLRDARGVWFPGGRQWRLVDAYAGTRTEAAFREVLERGGVIGGSSAGATIQGSFLARGDSRTNTVMMGDHQVGFGYLRDTAIDQHLLARNRQFDLPEILGAHPHLLGIGLDENTALVVQGDTARVMGESYVAIYDRGVRIPGGGEFYLLRAGDRFDLRSRTPSRPGGNAFEFIEPVGDPGGAPLPHPGRHP
jgi:cyanophycinase